MTMHLIASSGVTPAGGTGFYDFLSIPQTFKHLKFIYSARDTGSFTTRGLFMEINGVGGTSYSHMFLKGNGSSNISNGSPTTSAGRFDWGEIPAANTAANIFGVGVIDIIDYANTSRFKTLRINHGYDANGSGEINQWSGLFANTGGIQNIRIYPNNAFAQYSRIDLYGITDNPIATGA